MTFSDLYFTNNDWERSTVLEINVGAVNKNKELTAFKALSLYSGYEVVGFSSTWVTLMAPVCLTTMIREVLMTLKQFKYNLDTQIKQLQIDTNSIYFINSRPMFKPSHDNLIRLKTLLEVREALEEVESWEQ